MNQKNYASDKLVLGTAWGYGAREVEAFVNSLEQVGFQGRLILIGLDPAVLAGRKSAYHISSAGFKLLSYSTRLRSFQNRGRMRWIQQLTSTLGKLTPQAAWPKMALMFCPFLHIACSRYFLYQTILESVPAVERVLLCDVRDVIFNQDPFDLEWSEDLHLYLEEQPWTLGSEPVNRGWLDMTYDVETCKRLYPRPISCSGTTLGKRDAMLSYLSKMTREMARLCSKIVGSTGVDQTIHNRLLWDGLLPKGKVHENGSHLVFTAKLPALNLGTDPVEEETAKLRLRARSAAILHQYDWLPVNQDFPPQL